MKSKNPKIQILKKGIATFMSAMLMVTPLTYATTSLDDSYLESTLWEKILYGTIGSTVREIEEYFKVDPHATLYITNETQLRAFAEYVNNGNDCSGKQVVLLNDIEVDSNVEWTPIKDFNGTFDGQGYTLKGIKYVREEKTYENLKKIGFFSNIKSNGKIKNLIVKDFNINILYDENDINLENHDQSYYSVGNIAGSCEGIIENCANYSDIYGVYNVGGIVGNLANDGSTINCYNEGTIHAYQRAGGIAGLAFGESHNEINNEGEIIYDNQIINCINKGNIVAQRAAGGIIGLAGHDLLNNEGSQQILNESILIQNCLNNGNVKVTNTKHSAGGIIGKTISEIALIENCTNTGIIEVAEVTGTEVSSKNNIKINNCINNNEKVENIQNANKIVGAIDGVESVVVACEGSEYGFNSEGLIDGNGKIIIGSVINDFSEDSLNPTIKTNVYVENALETNRYTSGKEVIIEVTTTEIIQGDYNRPELEVSFSESGVGKYNYNGKQSGIAKCIDAKINLNGTTTWTYLYQIQQFDEGKIQVKCVNGEITDLAGKTSNLKNDKDTYLEVDSNIYADTTAPTVTIVPLKVQRDAEGNMEYVPIEKDVTNSTNLIYKFILSENVDSLKKEDITVINGEVKFLCKIEAITDNSISVDVDGDGKCNNIIDVALLYKYIKEQREEDSDDVTIEVNGEEIEVNVDIDGDNTANTEKDLNMLYSAVKGLIDVTPGLIGENTTNAYIMHVDNYVEPGNSEEVKVIIEQNAFKDKVGLGNVRREHSITVDKIKPTLISHEVIKSADGEKITVNAIFSEHIVDPSGLRPSIKIGGKESKGIWDAPVCFNPNKVSMTYNKTGAEGGNVEVKLNGTAKDAAGNDSQPLNLTIETDIILEQQVVKVGNDIYSFEKNGHPITNFTNPTYFIKNNKIKVTKIAQIEGEEVTTVYEYTITEDLDLSHMKYMKIVEDTEAEEDKNNNGTIEENEKVYKLEFYTTNRAGSINILDANIYFDTKAPILTTEVIANNPVSSNIYGIGSEFIIKSTTSEKVREGYIIPELNVKFAGNLGKFNNGKAQYVETIKNENETTFVYRYVVSEGDEGAMSLEYTSGKIVDLAGNETQATALNSQNNKFILNNVQVDTNAPTVAIVAKDVSNNITNANSLVYEFTWSEEVTGFTLEDITVNNGTKGELVKGEGNVYTMSINTNTEPGNMGEVQVIVEQNACHDKVGLSNVRTESVIRVDKIAPILISLEAYGKESPTLSKEIAPVKEYYKPGDIVEIVATFSENIANSTAPELVLQFSESGNAKGTVSPVTKEGNKITYTYTIATGDAGTLSVKGFTGEVIDVAGNETIVTKRNLDGDTIIIDNVAPSLKELKVISPTTGTYKAGQEIEIHAIYDENVYVLKNNEIKNITSETAPTLKVKFGNGAEREATFKEYAGEDKTKLKYTISILDGENGLLSITSYSNKENVKVCDIAGNGSTLNKKQTGSEITADTVRPEVIKITAEVQKPHLMGTWGSDGTYVSNPTRENVKYHKAGDTIKITLTFNEEVKVFSNSKIAIAFADEKESLKDTDYKYCEYGTNLTQISDTIEFLYTIEEGENGYLWVTVSDNQFEDIAGNKNGEKEICEPTLIYYKDSTNEEITALRLYADTTNPTFTRDFDISGTQNEQTITVCVSYSEGIFDLDKNNWRQLLDNTNLELLPKMIYRFGQSDNLKTVTATRMELQQNADHNQRYHKVYYQITKDPNVSGEFMYSFIDTEHIYDRAGNPLKTVEVDTIAPILEKVEVLSNAPAKYNNTCKEGNEIYVIATFNEPIDSQNMKLKIKVGEGDEKELNAEIVAENAKQIKFTYVVENDVNGKFKILDLYGDTDSKITSGDNTYGWVKDEKGNIKKIYNFEDENIAIIGKDLIDVDTIAPTITKVEAKVSDKVIATYSAEKNECIVGRTNADTVNYVITFSENIKLLDADAIKLINAEKGKVTVRGNTLTIEAHTITESVQSLIVPKNIFEDNVEHLCDQYIRFNAVTVDFTKPTVRFISEYNGGVYVLPTNVGKVEIRPSVEISEDISKIEYKWDNGEYDQIENYSSSSDISVPSKAFTEYGQYELFIKVTDLAGNIAETSKTYKVINSNIYIELSTGEQTNEYITATVLFGTDTENYLTDNRKVTFKAEGSNEVITLDAAGTDSKGNVQYIIETNGIIYAEATDKVGNKVFTECPVRNIDKVDPEISIELNGANLVIGTGEEKAVIRTNVEVSDNNLVEEAKYAFLQENIDVTNITSEQKAKINNNLNIEAKIENALSGTYYLYVIAIDSAGNEKIFKSNPFIVAQKQVSELITFEQEEEDIKDKAYVNISYDYSIIKDANVELLEKDYGNATEYYAEFYGNTTIIVKAWDACGNEVTHSHEVTDIVGPEFNILGNPENWTNGDVSLEIQSEAPLEELTLNGESILGENKYRVNTVIDTYGTYTFEATDIYNNTSKKEIEVKIDKSAPEITDVKIENGAIVITANDIDKTLNKELSGLAEYAITDTTEVPQEWSTSNEIKVTKDDNFFVWAKDNAGNITTKEEIVVRDTTAPELTITTDVELDKWTNTDIKVGVKANEELSSLVVKYKENEEDKEENILETKTHTIISNGTYEIIAKDKSGNETKETIAVTKIDKVAPEISDVDNEGKEITITAIDGGSGVKEYAITSTTEEPVEWSKEATIKVTEDGTFYAWVKDNAGNVKVSESPIVVDTTAPELTITTDVELDKWTNTDIKVDVKSNEELNSLVVKYKENEEDKEENILETKTHTIISNGTYEIIAKDKSGNETKEKIEVTKIDKIAPEISDVDNEGKDITITATDEEGGSGIAEYAITSTTEEPVEWSKEATIKVTEDGTFYALVKDNAGNVKVLESPIVVDTTAPIITFNYLSQTVTVGMPLEAYILTNEEATISYSWDKENWTNSEGYIAAQKVSKKSTTPGTYTLYAKATDKAGNESAIQTLEFNVSNIEDIKQPEIIFEDIPTIQINGVRYVKVSSDMTKEGLTDKMNGAALCGKTPEYTKLTEDGKLKTGSEISINGSIKYVIVVNGDVNCDGKIDFLGDIILANDYRIGIGTLSTIQRLAADVNNDRKVDFISDILSINDYRIGVTKSL